MSSTLSSPSALDSGPEILSDSTPVKSSHQLTTVYTPHRGQRNQASVCSSPMMLPEMVATRSSSRNGRLHCMHYIALLKILQDVIPPQGKEDAESYHHHDPETMDDCLLVELKEFNKDKLSIAVLDLHGD